MSWTGWSTKYGFISWEWKLNMFWNLFFWSLGVVNKPFSLVELEWCHVSFRLHIFFWRLCKPPPHPQPHPPSAPLIVSITAHHPLTTIMLQSIWLKLMHSLKQSSSGCIWPLKKCVCVFFFCFTQKGIPYFCLFLENRGRKKNAFFFVVCFFSLLLLRVGTTRFCHVLTTVTFLWNSCVGRRLGLYTIAGDEPETNKTVQGRWFWTVIKISLIMSQSHKTVFSISRFRCTSWGKFSKSRSTFWEIRSCHSHEKWSWRQQPASLA